MKQFITYTLATIAGIWITIMIAGVGVFLMTLVILSVGIRQPEVKVDPHSVLHLDLSGEIIERTENQSLIGQLYGFGMEQHSLKDMVAALRHAADDKSIDGVFIDCKGATAGTASLSYLRDEIARFKQSGKWVVAYGDAYTQGNYYLASVADSLWVNPVGAVDIHGLGGRLIFYKGLLDKLGVDVQVIKVGTYKSAVEPYILTEPSEANRMQVKSYLDPIWGYLTERIAESRGVEPQAVNGWADSIMATADPLTLPAAGVVTGTCYRHEALDWMKSRTGRAKKSLRLVSPEKYISTLKHRSSSTKIAVLYAVGDIVDIGDEGIVGNKMVPLILQLAEDDDIDALVLRVNSGGGSAFASEQIWEALEQFKATGKPFYVSMGDVAASGGYYISCGADKIYCQPVTLTGSIGIFGLIPSIKGLLNDHLGVTTSLIATNPGADMGIIDPLTVAQRAAMQRMIDRGYATFTSRCAEGRHVPVDSILAIAEGRVWDGMTAKTIGLVDELGTLDDCIKDLVQANGYARYELVAYPKQTTEWWSEIITEAKRMKTSAVSDELGEAAPYYEAVKRIGEMEHIQCRMPNVEVVN